MKNYLQITTAIPNRDNADKIANELIDKKLASCVQIVGPAESVYVWNKRKEKTVEFILFIKTREDLFADIELLFKKIHPYKTPEIIALPIAKGNKEYLEWIDSI